MKRANDMIQTYAERLQPQLRLFYRSAHAMTGNRQLAERALSDGVLDAYMYRGEWHKRMSFREGVTRSVSMAARDQIKKEPEATQDWMGIPGGEGDRPLILLLSREAQPVQRLMVLRYGCGLSLKDISAVMGVGQDEAREALTRCQARLERELKEANISFKSFDRYAGKELRHWMNRESNEPINVGYFLSTFEKDAAAAYQPRRIVSRVIKWTLACLGALVLALMVWVIAVLLES